MFDFHVCIRERLREREGRFVFPAQTDRHVVVSEGEGGRERERERERLAGRNARICWS